MARNHDLLSELKELEELKSRQTEERRKQRRKIAAIARALREEAGVSISRLSKETGISRISIYKFEDGEDHTLTSESAELIIKVCSRQS